MPLRKPAHERYTILVVFACSWDLDRKIEQAAKKLGITKSSLMREAVKEYVERLLQNNGGDR